MTQKMPSPVTGLAFFLAFTVLQQPSDSKLYYSIPEQREQGFFIASILSDARLKENYTSPSNTELQFEILPGRHQRWFTVDPRTGVLRTSTQAINREECGDHLACVLNVEVAVVRPTEHFRVFSVEVNVRDVNDNAPRFDRERYELSISEGAAPGALLYRLPLARDSDLGLLSVQRYLLLPSGANETFELRTTLGADGTKVPNLVLKRELDREAKDGYSLRLFAFDGGDPQNSGSVYVDVTVADVNDNDPVFERPFYNVTVQEDIDSSSALVTVHATDADLGVNGLVRYAFASTTLDVFGELFLVNATTGEILLLRKFDSSYRESYSLVVNAVDGGVESNMGTTRVVVNVQDVNSHPPSIAVNSMAANKTAEVAEGQPAGAFVAYVSVLDQDRGANGEIVCTVEGSDFSLQLLHRNTYKIVTLGTLDREVRNETFVPLSCMDMGTPALTSEENLRVVILDENDNPPVFLHDHYEADLPENSPFGTVITVVSATDLDISDNSVIVYSLSKKTGGYVSVNPHSGVITTTELKFDYELMQTYQFEVIATDRGTPSLSSTALVKINIININDCPPIFSKFAFSFGVLENLPAPAEVGTVTAEDRDITPFDDFRFRLDEPSGGAEFQIDPKSGRITTLVELDRERVGVYYLRVFAVDFHNSTLASTASVTIHVADRNDNEPVVSYPREEDSPVQVSTFAPKGYVVAKMDAEDLDFGLNAKLVYSLEQGPQYFKIDPLNGALYVSQSLRSCDPQTFRLAITVSDQGTPPLSANAILSVTVNDSAALAAELSLTTTNSGWLARTLDFGSHQTIIIALGAITMTLVVMLVAAIIFVKRCRGGGQGGARKGVQGYGENGQETVYLSAAAVDERGGLRDSGGAAAEISYYGTRIDDECCTDLDPAEGCCFDGCDGGGSLSRSREGAVSAAERAELRSRCGSLQEDDSSTKSPFNSMNLYTNEPKSHTNEMKLSPPRYSNGRLTNTTAAASAAAAAAPCRADTVQVSLRGPCIVPRPPSDLDDVSATTTDLSNPDSGRGQSGEEDDPPSSNSAPPPLGGPCSPRAPRGPSSSKCPLGERCPTNDHRRTLTTFMPKGRQGFSPQSARVYPSGNFDENPSGVSRGNSGCAEDSVTGECNDSILRGNGDGNNAADGGRFREINGGLGSEYRLPNPMRELGTAVWTPRHEVNSASLERQQRAGAKESGNCDAGAVHKYPTAPHRYPSSQDAHRYPSTQDALEYPYTQDAQKYPSTQGAYRYPTMPDAHRYLSGEDAQRYPVMQSSHRQPSAQEAHKYPSLHDAHRHPSGQRYPSRGGEGRMRGGSRGPLRVGGREPLSPVSSRMETDNVSEASTTSGSFTIQSSPR